MIIWGSRNTTKKMSSGPFHCPRCGPDKTYDVMQVNRWFTLYFIPIIPLGSQGQYIQCRSCAGTFDSKAINYDPVVAHEKFMAELDTVIVRSLLVLALGAPPVTDSVLTRIAGQMQTISNRELELSQMHDLLGAVERRKMTIRSVLSPLVADLNNAAKNMVLHALIAGALSPSPQQRKIIEEAGNLMGFSKKDIEALLKPATVS